jgi:hypothetical protein
MATTKKAAREHDIVRLERADKAMRETTPRMRRASLLFLWDKYVVHAEQGSASGVDQ